MAEDGPLEFVVALTGLELIDGEAQLVFLQLDLLCREAAALAGFPEWLEG